MRIFYDHQVFSLQDAGGASRYHFELLRNLQASRDVSLELLIGSSNSVMPFATLRQPNTRVFAHSTSMKPGLTRYALNELFSATLAPLRGPVDIYHPTLYRALPWVRRSRIVVTHHDCIHERFPHLFPNAASIVEAKRKLFAQADAILCVSASSRSDLLHFYNVAPEKAHVVHHGFSPLPPPEATIDERVPYLLYVGSRAGYKNFGLLLQAFHRSGLVADYRLLAVGGGPLTAAEQQQIASLHLTGSVTVIPKPEDATLARAYRDAALFIYPSLYEGFGFPPLEAMSLGCPVLANRTSSLPEVCGEAAFYFNGAADELSHSLKSTLENEQQLAIKRKLGAAQVKLYDWGRCARSTLEVYRAVLGA